MVKGFYIKLGPEEMKKRRRDKVVLSLPWTKSRSTKCFTTSPLVFIYYLSEFWLSIQRRCSWNCFWMFDAQFGGCSHTKVWVLI